MKKRILIVDDEPAIASLLTRQFERAGYEMASACSVSAALALLVEQKYRFDAILLDGMEGDAVPFATEIRERGFPGPIVCVSNNPDIASQMMKPGRCTHEFDYKPRNLSGLIAFVGTLLAPPPASPAA